MQNPLATVIIPTLYAGEALAACLEALRQQTFQNFDTVIVDNSGAGLAAAHAAPPRVRVIENAANVGFGQAINQGIAVSKAELICTLNDDALPAPGWLENLIDAVQRNPMPGMFASRILLRDSHGRLDSAGLSIYPDGTTKQRGHGAPAEDYGASDEVLLPSACAALYRRSMLDAVGVFDADYFLYGEDAELGLRARLAGWKCVYVPGAVVEHAYSRSAGRASALKAFLVERNRLFTVVKLYPVALWPLTPFYSMWRYLAHFRALAGGRGLSSEFSRTGENWWRLVLIVGAAHWNALRHLPALLRKRREARPLAALSTRAFWKLLRRYHISALEVASQQ